MNSAYFALPAEFEKRFGGDRERKPAYP